MGTECAGCQGSLPEKPQKCPACLKQGVDSYFCSQECFVKNWATHKAVHNAAPTATESSSSSTIPPAIAARPSPPGTYDPFPDSAYTGSLRAAYPLPFYIPSQAYNKRQQPKNYPFKRSHPMRVIKDGVKLPDYAEKGSSISEEIASRIKSKPKILNAAEIQGMRTVCRLAREVLDVAASHIRPGITTHEIDEIVFQECMKRDSYPSPLNYYGFPRSVCTSINEVICHGIPDHRPLEEGDIINLDVTLYHGGYHGDLNATYPVGKVSPASEHLIKSTRQALDEAIALCKPGALFRDIGNTIEPIIKEAGLAVNRTYCGHGINNLFHCAPNIPHYAKSKTAGDMKPGMCFTIEPMVNEGDQQDEHWPDDWTAVTKDGKRSAQFEETLLITEDGVEVLTGAHVNANGFGGVANGDGSKKKSKKKKKKKKSKATGAGAEEEAEGEDEDNDEGEGEDGAQIQST